MTGFKSGWDFIRFSDAVLSRYRYAHTVETRDFLRALTESAEHRALRISANAQYWRAQLGTYLKERVINSDPELTVVTEEPVPYSADRMKPKRSSAREGRVNPKGIPCLYLATTKETALAEMRPYLGALLSLAMLQTDRELRVVDVSVDHDKRLTRDLLLGNSPTEEITAGIWSQVDQAFAEPVNADDDSMASYAPTQIMAEALVSAS